ncbi:MAG: hypothetical protein MOB07_16150 [Acidobacteria bacterium]|nr:hypothetical protein [Acidobacteriota bacterium]
MKHNFIRYSMILLLIGLVAMTAGQAYAQRQDTIEIESFSWGMSSGQLARVSVANFAFADGSVRSRDPITVRIKLLDMEGEVIAQSDEIRIEPGKTRFWDVPREQIRLVGDPGTGRVQVRARIHAPFKFTSEAGPPFPFGRPLAPTVEIIDAVTGRTTALYNPFITVDYLEEPPGR